jgi:AcrR family transcriptional regulator
MAEDASRGPSMAVLRVVKLTPGLRCDPSLHMLATLTSQSVSDANFSIPREASIVRSVRKRTAKMVRRKARYHHGELREALIGATRRLVEERGAEHFSLADACRVAGVTTAAPYRHFSGKQEILAEIASRGFDELRKRSMAAVAERGEGTLGAIIAMGQAYVDVAVEETAVFRLMFGQEPSLKKAEHVLGTGHACFAHVINQVALYCERNKVRGDAQEIALKLWTFVHGAASLLIDEDYKAIAPQIDVSRLIASATPGLLAASPRATKG